ncbi:hypothetical protein SSAG_01125 [Streptomyces sp. Mg1]|nr:hypothetical protein SSAG_01125 [Streptomyces sp. Mg1]
MFPPGGRDQTTGSSAGADIRFPAKRNGTAVTVTAAARKPPDLRPVTQYGACPPMPGPSA